MSQLSRVITPLFFYRNRAEQFEAIIPYIQIGLERNERCLYVADDNCLRLVLQALEQAGIDTSEERRHGRLTVATKHETYLKQGSFNPFQTVAFLKQEVERAIADGFSGFRGTGEMQWAVDNPSALASLHQYEILLDAQFPKKFLRLCQYNEKVFLTGDGLAVRAMVEGERLRNVGATERASHWTGYVIEGWNPFNPER